MAEEINNRDLVVLTKQFGGKVSTADTSTATYKKESSETLYSVDAICEGPIEGLCDERGHLLKYINDPEYTNVNLGKGIYLNDVPILDSRLDKFNFVTNGFKFYLGTEYNEGFYDYPSTIYRYNKPVLLNDKYFAAEAAGEYNLIEYWNTFGRGGAQLAGNEQNGIKEILGHTSRFFYVSDDNSAENLSTVLTEEQYAFSDFQADGVIGLFMGIPGYPPGFFIAGGNPDPQGGRPNLNYLSTQARIHGFDEIESGATPFIHKIVNPYCDRLKVVIYVDSLYRINNDGHVKSESVNVIIEIANELNSDRYIYTGFIKGVVKGGKYLADVEFDLNLNPYTPANYHVKVYTASPKLRFSEKANRAMGIGVHAVVEMVSKRGPFSYPFTALVKSSINSDHFSSDPNRTFHAKLLKIKVPSNYDPITKNYYGNWSGKFHKMLKWTDNPAWIYYDLCTNQRYGIGNGEILHEDINKWELYKVAKYCDELVRTNSIKGATEDDFFRLPNSALLYMASKIPTTDNTYEVLSIESTKTYVDAEGKERVRPSPTRIFINAINSNGTRYSLEDIRKKYKPIIEINRSTQTVTPTGNSDSIIFLYGAEGIPNKKALVFEIRKGSLRRVATGDSGRGINEEQREKAEEDQVWVWLDDENLENDQIDSFMLELKEDFSADLVFEKENIGYLAEDSSRISFIDGFKEYLKYTPKEATSDGKVVNKTDSDGKDVKEVLTDKAFTADVITKNTGNRGAVTLRELVVQASKNTEKGAKDFIIDKMRDQVLNGLQQKIIDYEQIISDILDSNVYESVYDDLRINGKCMPRKKGYRDPLEPRFTANILIDNETNALKALNDLASIFRGLTYYKNNMIHTTVDVNKPVSYIFNNTNVKDGMFNYSSGSLDGNYTVAKILYKDSINRYKDEVEVVEDKELVREYGYIVKEILGFGVTSRDQARRMGSWLLATNKFENQSVTFTTDLQGLLLKPGDVIQVQDDYIRNENLQGRVLFVDRTNYSIKIDRQISSSLLKSSISFVYDKRKNINTEDIKTSLDYYKKDNSKTLTFSIKKIDSKNNIIYLNDLSEEEFQKQTGLSPEDLDYLDTFNTWRLENKEAFDEKFSLVSPDSPYIIQESVNLSSLQSSLDYSALNFESSTELDRSASLGSLVTDNLINYSLNNLYKIVTISEQDINQYTLFCVKFDRDKYKKIEDGKHNLKSSFTESGFYYSNRKTPKKLDLDSMTGDYLPYIEEESPYFDQLGSDSFNQSDYGITDDSDSRSSLLTVTLQGESRSEKLYYRRVRIYFNNIKSYIDDRVVNATEDSDKKYYESVKKAIESGGGFICKVQNKHRSVKFKVPYSDGDGLIEKTVFLGRSVKSGTIEGSQIVINNFILESVGSIEVYVYDNQNKLLGE